MSTTKLGTFDDLMEITNASIQPIARRLREVITKIDPSFIEVVRLGERAATFGIGPKKMSEGYTYILPHKEWVNLGFYMGTKLPDPAGLLEGTGATMRHIKVRSLKDTERPEIQSLIKAALKERKEALG